MRTNKYGSYYSNSIFRENSRLSSISNRDRVSSGFIGAAFLAFFLSFFSDTGSLCSKDQISFMLTKLSLNCILCLSSIYWRIAGLIKMSSGISSPQRFRIQEVTYLWQNAVIIMVIPKFINTRYIPWLNFFKSYLFEISPSRNWPSLQQNIMATKVLTPVTMRNQILAMKFIFWLP